MTRRAVVIGFLLSAFLCGFCFFNDAVIRQTVLVRCFLPVSVYGGLVLFVLCINPLLRRLRRGLALTGRELAVVVALALVACHVPGYGLMQYLTTFLILPHHYARTDVGWRSSGVLDQVPPYMLADVSGDESTVLNGFVQGLGEGTRHMPFSGIPWHGWTRTLGFWLPVVFTLAIACIALAVVVHRQWSDHEHIPYPIAGFAHALLPGPSRAWGPTLRSGLFWLGLLVPLAIHVNNWGAAWFPRYLLRVPLVFDFTSLGEVFPRLVRGGGWILLRPRLVLTVVGFAFFLATDVSLSLGVAPFAYCTIVGALAGVGVAVYGAHLSQGTVGYLHAGAFLSAFLVLVYRGRHYYWSVVRRSVFLSGREEVRPAEAWGGRVFLVACVVLVWQLSTTGLDWQLAFLYVCVAVALLVVVSRVVAETGVFYIYPTFFPCALLGGLLGFQALGSQAMLLMLIITSVLVVNPSEALMPFAVHANKLISLNGMKIGRAALLAAAVLAVGVAVALPATLYWQYDRGGLTTGHGWIIHTVPRLAFNEAVRVKYQLEAQGTLERAEALSGWERFAHISPSGPHLAAFGITFALVVLFSAARSRFARWPLHPVLFLVLGTWQSRILAPSFLLGWVVKSAVTRYGGHRAYQRLKALMIGLIAGEMLAGVLFIIFGAIYYLVTGEPPIVYNVLPI